MNELNYQELVANYYDNLNNNLRNFKGGPGFLETWVHDEDHNRSLLEIVDLAHSNGVKELAIRLPSAVLPTLDLTWLRLQAAPYGALKLDGSSLKFVSGKSAEDSADGAVGELYRDNVKRHKIVNEGPLDGKVLKIEEDGRVLAVLLDEQGIVKEARHTGFTGPLRSVVDLYCSVLKGRPLQEGAEHGTLRLEALLRSADRPVRAKGLWTPELADAVFTTPAHMGRQLWKMYLGKNELKRNFWRDPIPADWKALDMAAKMKKASEVLKKGCAKFGLQENVLITEIKNDTRLVLSYTQEAGKPNFGNHMIKLERWLRAELGFEVELQLESIEDRNKRVERSGRTDKA